ncbi:MAG: PorV/PorQ family protein [Bacteroidota bacterium]|nr:PorV/PorQ family protein [Bacteroidota bacterium]
MYITARRLASFLVLGSLMCLSAIAGNINRTGTAGAQELLIPVGARGVALGGSNVAFVNGVDAIYWNPAGLARSSFGTEAQFSHMTYLADIGVEYGAVGVTAEGIGTFGVSLKSLNFGDIPVTTEDNPDGTGQTYSPTYVTTGLSYSRLLSDRISIGATFNLVSESIMSTSATGFSFDAGVQYSGLGVPELKLGIVVKNVGPNITYSGSDLLRQGSTVGDIRGTQWYNVQAAAFELPSQMEIALAYDKKLNEMNAISIFSDYENNNYQDDIWKFGAEYSFKSLFFVRGGYNLSPNAPKDPTGKASELYDYTLGAGINYDLGGVNFTLDYAYRHVVFMNANQVFTVKLGF